MIIVRAVSVLVGLCLIVWVLDAAIRNFMLPRSTRVRMTAIIGSAVERLFNLLAPPTRSYAYRDKVYAMRAPVTLLAFQAVWFFLVFVGFAGIFWGLNEMTAIDATHFSGSALFTLGFASPTGESPLFVVYAEALIGLTLLALLISYLPTIYAAFQKREFVVAKLGVRGGAPARPWYALSVAQQTQSLSELDRTMWDEWEDWFIDIAESHTSLTILNFYRSPNPDNHWIATARAVLDIAALRIAVVDDPEPVGPHITIRSGVVAVRTIADHFGIPHEKDPAPDDPISITRAQFDAAVAFMADSGVPIRADREQAWRDFAGWRVNYDSIIEYAAERFIAPPNPWLTVTSEVSPFAQR
jgi:hypothetical protein